MGNRFDMESQHKPYKLIRNQQVGGSSPLAGTRKSVGYDHSLVRKEFGVTHGVTFS